MSTVIQTYGGGTFDLAKPSAEDVRLTDIAHALSNLCRFTGHCREFYSVAQHSVLASCFVAHDYPALRVQAARRALLHDAHEAYVGDWSRPLKCAMSHAKEAWSDWGVECAVIRKFFGDYNAQPLNEIIAFVDERLLATERRDVMAPGFDWNLGEAPFEYVITPWSPSASRELFLARFAYLFGVAETLDPLEVEYESWLMQTEAQIGDRPEDGDDGLQKSKRRLEEAVALVNKLLLQKRPHEEILSQLIRAITGGANA